MVGVIIPKIGSDPIGKMVEGISSVLSKHGYMFLLAKEQEIQNEDMLSCTVVRRKSTGKKA